MSNNSHLVSITKYALLVKKPGSTIRLMCREKRLGAVKLGTEWLVDLNSSVTKNATFQKRGRPMGTAEPKHKRRPRKAKTV